MTSRESRFLLIFDLDGTLLDFEKSERISLRKALAKYDRHLDDTQVAEYRRINAEEWRRFESGSQSKNETSVRRFLRFLAEEG
ncbi:MAG TPA: noncanonical pyrimidine nucleotidase, YjjG family, partial [Thermotogota bacterium]|nr:noncanonical pyrimidine nucleotidase, YjjG family [Thermotogota bacterium]